MDVHHRFYGGKCVPHATNDPSFEPSVKVSLSQMYYYYTRYQRDPIYIKLLVRTSSPIT